MDDLVNKAPSTRTKYRRVLLAFCNFIQQSPDALIQQRETELKAEKIWDQRGSERLLKRYLAHLETQGASISSQQVAYAAIRSFFEMRYMPLRMRRDDYPRGDSLGHRAITKMEIRRMLEHASIGVRALIHVLKDSGLRVSDVASLTLEYLQPGLRNGYEFIPINIITQKNKVQARTWIGPEAVDALHDYLDRRRHGSRKIPPENVTDASPLFRTRTRTVRPLSRSGMSSSISHMAERIGLGNQVSAHSFRKYFQTRMESAGVSPDWIDQIVGRKLMGVRGHYSLPKTRELFHAYQQGYDALRVNEEIATRSDIAS
jgi:site-specific recombinase XerD